MGRPAGSKNKPKGCTTISHCLKSQVRAQDEDHLEREYHNVLSIINGNEEESESEYEPAENDDSVLGNVKFSISINLVSKVFH